MVKDLKELGIENGEELTKERDLEGNVFCGNGYKQLGKFQEEKFILYE